MSLFIWTRSLNGCWAGFKKGVMTVKKEWKRSMGLLLHPTSLPGPCGAGKIGEAAYRWIDFLARSRQRIWQILPLCPADDFGCPYNSPASFAGNPLLIDTSRAAVPNSAEESVFRNFRAENDGVWLNDYALFMSLREEFGPDWTAWPRSFKMHDSRALEQWSREKKNVLEGHKFIQYRFFKQWGELKKYANDRGILIFGDIPMFTAHQSADVWANQELFLLDGEGRPIEVSGCPPDYFSQTGQVWGNPLYRWEEMAHRHYGWWIERMRAAFRQADIVRLDHFVGFVNYWAIPFGEKTAVRGQWKRGPGAAFFETAFRALGSPLLVAEDLGVVTPEVHELRDRFGMLGMRVLQFAFDDGWDNPHLPHNFGTNVVAYTGTHDNDTTVGWFHKLSQEKKNFCARYLGFWPSDPAWALMRRAAESSAALAIFPLQDVLRLGSEARMNTPGTLRGNWAWRFQEGMLSQEQFLAELAQSTGRG